MYICVCVYIYIFVCIYIYIYQSHGLDPSGSEFRQWNFDNPACEGAVCKSIATWGTVMWSLLMNVFLILFSFNELNQF